MSEGPSAVATFEPDQYEVELIHANRPTRSPANVIRMEVNE